MEVNLAVEGLKFMIIGMSVVFAFLVLLVIVINLQAKVLNKFFPEKSKIIPKVSQSQNLNSNEDEIVAAIMGAITTYRKK